MYSLEWYECLARLADKCSLQAVDSIKMLSEKEKLNQPLHLKYEALIHYLARKCLEPAYLDNNHLPTKTIFQDEEASVHEEEEEEEEEDNYRLEGLLGPQRNSFG